MGPNVNSLLNHGFCGVLNTNGGTEYFHGIFCLVVEHPTSLPANETKNTPLSKEIQRMIWIFSLNEHSLSWNVGHVNGSFPLEPYSSGEQVTLPHIRLVFAFVYKRVKK